MVETGEEEGEATEYGEEDFPPPRASSDKATQAHSGGKHRHTAVAHPHRVTLHGRGVKVAPAQFFFQRRCESVMLFCPLSSFEKNPRRRFMYTL